MSKFLGNAMAWKGSDGVIFVNHGKLYTPDQVQALMKAKEIEGSSLTYFMIEIHEPETTAVLDFPEAHFDMEQEEL